MIWIVKDRIASNCMAEFEILIPNARIMQIFCWFSVCFCRSGCFSCSSQFTFNQDWKCLDLFSYHGCSITFHSNDQSSGALNRCFCNLLWKKKKNWNPPYPVNRSACIIKKRVAAATIFRYFFFLTHQSKLPKWRKIIPLRDLTIFPYVIT